MGARLALVLTAPGDLRADLTWLRLRHTTIVRGKENLSRIGYVEVAAGTVLLSFPVDFGSPDVWGGTTLAPGDAFVQGPGSRVHHRTSGARSWAWIAVEQERLNAHCLALLQTTLAMPRARVIIHPDYSAFSQLSRLVSDASRMAISKRCVVEHPEAMRALEHHVLDALVHCLTTGTRTEARNRQANVVVAFENALETCGHDMHMPAFVTLLGTTDRVLRSACAESLGIGPMEYRRLRRLNRVRSALLHARAGARVSEIAAAFGISEVGRFAGEYLKAFGEMPSFTMRSANSALIDER